MLVSRGLGDLTPPEHRSLAIPHGIFTMADPPLLSESCKKRTVTPARTPDQDRPAPLRRLETSFSHGTKWKALISKYIGTIPLSNEPSCVVEQSNDRGPPPRTPVSTAMIAKVGAAAKESQSAAPTVVA